MANIPIVAILLISFFAFVIKTTFWGFDSLKAENTLIVKRAKQYQKHNKDLHDEDLSNFQTGVLE